MTLTSSGFATIDRQFPEDDSLSTAFLSFRRSLCAHLLGHQRCVPDLEAYKNNSSCRHSCCLSSHLEKIGLIVVIYMNYLPEREF